MGVKTCMVCQNKSSQTISLISVPEDKKDVWSKFFNIQNRPNKKKLFICNKHFNTEDFIDNKKSRLKTTAEPILEQQSASKLQVCLIIIF